MSRRTALAGFCKLEQNDQERKSPRLSMALQDYSYVGSPYIGQEWKDFMKTLDAKSHQCHQRAKERPSLMASGSYRVTCPEEDMGRKHIQTAHSHGECILTVDGPYIMGISYHGAAKDLSVPRYEKDGKSYAGGVAVDGYMVRIVDGNELRLERVPPDVPETAYTSAELGAVPKKVSRASVKEISKYVANVNENWEAYQSAYAQVHGLGLSDADLDFAPRQDGRAL